MILELKDDSVLDCGGILGNSFPGLKIDKASKAEAMNIHAVSD